MKLLAKFKKFLYMGFRATLNFRKFKVALFLAGHSVVMVTYCVRKIMPTRSTLGNKFWLCCSFFIKLTTCRAFARSLANQPISAPHFFNPQQMFLLRVKLIAQCEKRDTTTKTCNETMLRDKLRVFVSRISPPLEN